MPTNAEKVRTDDRIDGIRRLAEDVFEDPERAREWLTGANPALGGRRPIDVATTEDGRREAEAVLMRFAHGIFD